MYEKYLDVIDKNADVICSVSDFLWDNAELGFGEYKAAEYITKLLEENGFTVERNISDIPTAFKATFGEGSPKLGILAEYDALSGMSQEGGVPEKKPIEGVDVSHGCGHNLFAGGSFAASLAVKAYIEETGRGSITLFGCPAEESGAGKVFMARDGVFSGVDAIVSWHPESMYMVRTRPALANVKVNYTFEGTSAHAGASPHKGRSALDAVELMNIGANFLREHMELTSRVHYAILDAGGTSPNMVQSHAVVQYMIRAVDCASVRELHERIDRIAKGASLMTDTTVSSEVVSAYSNLITIPSLQKTANEAMHDIPLPVPSKEEMEYGRKILESLNPQGAKDGECPFATEVFDPTPPVNHGGSTDTADVSWNCPTVQMHIANWVKGTPAHSWQSSSQSRASYAKKAMLYAGKAVASTHMRLIDNPEIIETAKKEHFEKTGGVYVCGLPSDLKPDILPKE